MKKSQQLKRSDFQYDLPKELIAQEPVEPRDRSRLFVYDRTSSKVEHRFFSDLGDYFQSGDLLVLNNSKVLPARLIGEKQPTGGKVEVFLLKHVAKKLGEEIWQVMLGGRVSEGLSIGLSHILKAKVLKNNKDGTWLAAFNLSGQALMSEVETIGHMPLPPYIHKGADRFEDRSRYQTVFANDKKCGSVAAPTAGLHFTPELLKKIKRLGVEVAQMTLNVGLGTFAPVKTDNIADHQMHSERFEVPSQTVKKIIETKKQGGRIIAVGTTAARTLESLAQKNDLSELADYKIKNPESITGWTSIFIYPPYEFKIVDCLVTNFHLPQSTLLMLLAAFLSQDGKKGLHIEKKLYTEAIKMKYRFFSYGDAMLII